MDAEEDEENGAGRANHLQFLESGGKSTPWTSLFCLDEWTHRPTITQTAESAEQSYCSFLWQERGSDNICSQTEPWTPWDKEAKIGPQVCSENCEEIQTQWYVHQTWKSAPRQGRNKKGVEGASLQNKTTSEISSTLPDQTIEWRKFMINLALIWYTTMYHVTLYHVTLYHVTLYVWTIGCALVM